MSELKEDLYLKAASLFADGKVDEAIGEFQKALGLDPLFYDALQGLGMAYFQKGMLDEAIEVGKKMVETNPDDVLAHTSLSMFYQRKGMIPEAEAEGNKARALGLKK